MKSSLSLPNELLHSIIEYIAYTPTLPSWHSPSSSLFRRASPELLVLSVVDWRLRQACLPFLFANIEIALDREAMNSKDYLALFSKFTKILVIGSFLDPEMPGYQILSQILPELKHLLFVELHNCRARTDLLRAILAHPTVTSVLVHQLPDESMCNDDLSKITIGRLEDAHQAFVPHFQKYSNRGLRLACLQLSSSDPLNGGQADFASLNGLEKLQVYNGGADLISPSWLSMLSSIHPTLNECWFLQYMHNDRSAHQTPPFLSSFLEESKKQGLRKFFIIKEFGLCRALGQSPPEWYVVGLVLKNTFLSTSLLEMLMLAASSFPKLRNLSLDLVLLKTTYNVNNFASALARFSSLRILYLSNVFRRISVESGNVSSAQLDYSQNAFIAPQAYVQHHTLLLTSCLAKQVITLDSIYVEEDGHEYDESGSVRRWSLRGWLHVLNSKREIDGTLSSFFLNSL
ncbi:hypothetical protein C8R42DRAFT_309095 [Lentinula raphanica]|nr:hypothetical protein C8R42DRAFT_309095 [Lentinula raphanica]